MKSDGSSRVPVDGGVRDRIPKKIRRSDSNGSQRSSQSQSSNATISMRNQIQMLAMTQHQRKVSQSSQGSNTNSRTTLYSDSNSDDEGSHRVRVGPSFGSKKRPESSKGSKKRRRLLNDGNNSDESDAESRSVKSLKPKVSKDGKSGGLKSSHSTTKRIKKRTKGRDTSSKQNASKSCENASPISTSLPNKKKSSKNSSLLSAGAPTRKHTRVGSSRASPGEDTPPYPPSILQTPPLKTLSKRQLKPKLKVGSPVYAAWWPDAESRRLNSHSSWYEGRVKSVKEVDRGGDYGPTNYYCIAYDDGDELTNVGDIYVYPKDDYLLSTTRKKDWMGVRQAFDEGSRDAWAKVTGWYEAFIDGRKFSFSRLSEALRAYDTSVVLRKGAKTQPADLNLPDEWQFSSRERDHLLREVSNQSGEEVMSTPDLKGVAHIKGNMNHQGNKSQCSEDSDEEPLKKRKKEKHHGGKISSVSTANASSKQDYPGNSNKKPKILAKADPKKGTFASRFVGVSWHKTLGKYVSYITHKKKFTHLGYYISEVDAAQARDEAARQLKFDAKANFTSLEDYEKEKKRELGDAGFDNGVSMSMIVSKVTKSLASASEKAPFATSASSPYCSDPTGATSEQDSPRADSKKERHSRFAGVSWNKANEKYFSYVIYNKKQIHLGCFSSETDAAQMRDETVRQLKLSAETNFISLEDYENEKRRELGDAGFDVDASMSAIRSKVNEVLLKASEMVDKTDVFSTVNASSKADPKKGTFTSRFVGVSRQKVSGKYASYVYLNKKYTHLGYCISEVDAAQVRDEAVRQLKLDAKANFTSLKDYENEKKRELGDTGFDNGVSMSMIVSKVTKFLLKASASEKGPFDSSASSPGSSDPSKASPKQESIDVSTSTKADTMKERHSSFIGVSLIRNKYYAFVRRKKKQIHLGCYTSEIDAAQARDEAVRQLKLGVKGMNFTSLEDYENMKKREVGDSASDDDASISTIRSKVNKILLKASATVEVDATEVSGKVPSNCVGTSPGSSYRDSTTSNQHSLESIALTSACPNKEKASSFIGVSVNTRRTKYIAYVKHIGEHIHLGSYNSEVDAAQAHDEAVRQLKLNGKINFISPKDYENRKKRESGYSGSDVGVSKSAIVSKVTKILLKASAAVGVTEDPKKVEGVKSSDSPANCPEIAALNDIMAKKWASYLPTTSGEHFLAEYQNSIVSVLEDLKKSQNENDEVDAPAPSTVSVCDESLATKDSNTGYSAVTNPLQNQPRDENPGANASEVAKASVITRRSEHKLNDSTAKHMKPTQEPPSAADKDLHGAQNADGRILQTQSRIASCGVIPSVGATSMSRVGSKLRPVQNQKRTTNKPQKGLKDKTVVGKSEFDTATFAELQDNKKVAHRNNEPSISMGKQKKPNAEPPTLKLRENLRPDLIKKAPHAAANSLQTNSDVGRTLVSVCKVTKSVLHGGNKSNVSMKKSTAESSSQKLGLPSPPNIASNEKNQPDPNNKAPLKPITSSQQPFAAKPVKKAMLMEFTANQLRELDLKYPLGCLVWSNMTKEHSFRTGVVTSVFIDFLSPKKDIFYQVKRIGVETQQIEMVPEHELCFAPRCMVNISHSPDNLETNADFLQGEILMCQSKSQRQVNIDAVLRLKKSLLKEQARLSNITDDSTGKYKNLLHTLHQLDRVDVNRSILAETLIGKSLKALKSHSNTCVAQRARELITKWKDIASAEGNQSYYPENDNCIFVYTILILKGGNRFYVEESVSSERIKYRRAPNVGAEENESSNSTITTATGLC